VSSVIPCKVFPPLRSLRLHVQMERISGCDCFAISSQAATTPSPASAQAMVLIPNLLLNCLRNYLAQLFSLW
jgi:hypothetical protein